MERDPHWRRTHRLQTHGLEAEPEPMTYRQVYVRLGDRRVPAAFDGEKQRYLEALRFANGDTFRSVRWGQGRLFLASYPVELAEGLEAATAVYRSVLQRSGVEPPFAGRLPAAGVLVRPIFFADAILYLFLSESSQAEEIDLRDKETGAELHFRLPAQRARLVLLDRETGARLAAYGF